MQITPIAAPRRYAFLIDWGLSIVGDDVRTVGPDPSEWEFGNFSTTTKVHGELRRAGREYDLADVSYLGNGWPPNHPDQPFELRGIEGVAFFDGGCDRMIFAVSGCIQAWDWLADEEAGLIPPMPFLDPPARTDGFDCQTEFTGMPFPRN